MHTGRFLRGTGYHNGTSINMAHQASNNDLSIFQIPAAP